MTYNVKLEVFEGPLDLLLHLIKKNEVDIYSIPIAVITDQYIEYIDVMKEMNLDFAGEFLVMAATLVHIKSRMLLPVEVVDEGSEDAGVDPREELVRRLLEYQRFKDAAAELNARVVLGRDVFPKGQSVTLEAEEPGLVNVSLFDLMEAIKGILARAPKGAGLNLTVERFKIADKINYVLERLGSEKSAAFTSLFADRAMRGEIIVTFLAILELAKLQLIKIHQTDDGIIRVYLREGSQEQEAAVN